MSTLFRKLQTRIRQTELAAAEALEIMDTIPLEVKARMVGRTGGHWTPYGRRGSLWFYLPMDKETYRSARSALFKQGWHFQRHWGKYNAKLAHEDYETEIVISLEPGVAGATCELVPDGTKTVTKEVTTYKVVCRE